MVSAGELGTNPRELEAELNKILDIAHSWGAVLLLDEADVFLEKRTIQDIHRNALVSIFLRLLEYFQGILFLTTNRVETFDDAFQSRIHVALRYGELTTKAKRTVWKMFLDKVSAKEGLETVVFKETDYDRLARHNLNGRQVRSLSMAVNCLFVLTARAKDQKRSPHGSGSGCQREGAPLHGPHCQSPRCGRDIREGPERRSWIRRYVFPQLPKPQTLDPLA